MLRNKFKLKQVMRRPSKLPASWCGSARLATLYALYINKLCSRLVFNMDVLIKEFAKQMDLDQRQVDVLVQTFGAKFGVCNQISTDDYNKFAKLVAKVNAAYADGHEALAYTLKFSIQTDVAYGFLTRNGLFDLSQQLRGENVLSIGCGHALIERALMSYGVNFVLTDNGEWSAGRDDEIKDCPIFDKLSSIEAAEKYAGEGTDKTKYLFVSWPVHESSMVYDALIAARNIGHPFRFVIYNKAEGLTGDDAFHNILDTYYESRPAWKFECAQWKTSIEDENHDMSCTMYQLKENVDWPMYIPYLYV